MKKLFSLIFLLCITATNCWAVKDCRYIKNKVLVEAIKNQQVCRTFETVYNSGKLLRIDYREIIFMINDHSIGNVVAATPIINNTLRKIVGEIITKVTVNANTVGDVLDALTTNTGNFKIQVHQSVPKFFESRNYSHRRYMFAKRLVDFIEGNFSLNVNIVKSTDRIYYRVSPGDRSGVNFDNLQVVHETPEGEKNLFAFQGDSFVDLSPSLLQKGWNAFMNLFFSNQSTGGYNKLD